MSKPLWVSGDDVTATRINYMLPQFYTNISGGTINVGTIVRLPEDNVNTGDVILSTQGTPFHDAVNTYTKVIKVTSTLFVVTWIDTTASPDVVKARVVVVDANFRVVTLGTVLTVDATTATFIGKPSYVNDTTVVIPYVKTGSPNSVTLIALTINVDNTLTAGTPLVVESTVSTATPRAWETALVDTNKLVSLYRHSSGGTSHYARVITVSGTTLSAGSAAALSDTSTTATVNSSLCKITTSKALVTYSRSDTDLYGAVVTISGTTASWGTATSLSATNPRGFIMDSDYAEANKAFIAWESDGGGGTVEAACITLSGTTLTNTGTINVAIIADLNDVRICANSALQATVVFSDNTGSAIKSSVLTFNSSGVNTGQSDSTISSGYTFAYGSIAAIAQGKSIIVYQGVSPSTGRIKLLTDGNDIDGQDGVSLTQATDGSQILVARIFA